MSRKIIESLDLSVVNLIEWWQEFRWFMKVSSSCSDLFQSIQISSIYLYQAKGCIGQVYTWNISNCSMNMLANERAKRVPMAVPARWTYCSPLNSKLFLYKTNLSRLMSDVFEGKVPLDLFLAKVLPTAIMPSQLRMFV